MDNNERIAALNVAAQAEADAQAENLVVDFDKALEEWRGDAKFHQVKFKGQVFNVPRQKPFAFALFVARHCIKKRDGKQFFEVADEHVEQFFRLMFGQEFLDALEGSDAEFSFIFAKIVPTIMELWGSPVKQGKNRVGTQG